MIQANELRIGNKLLFTDSPHQGILTVNSAIIKQAEDDIKRFNYFFQPIPITEEWLLKFGFESLRDGWFMFSEKGDIKFDISYITESNIYFYCCGKTRTLKFVHDVQNLYHALTQTELQIKEP
ncbi:MAG TPA: hypothetical protein PKD51_18965 [Saprospiraceae bacterium]|nr:hypothetical protein [Saprospiraceae bacterium]HMU05948.1 hypothetical protein [Saprospiraceae bacterium]